jgi:TPR repeat protein
LALGLILITGLSAVAGSLRHTTTGCIITPQMAAPAAGVRGALGAEKTRWDDASLAEFNLAAESGDVGAQCALGKKMKKEDPAGAVRWFRAAAEQGHAEAQSELGWCFHYGFGVDQDAAEAASWYRKSAKQGHADAQFELGDCLIIGNGVGRDSAEAASWFRKAAEQGHTDAQYWHGFCFKRGEGVDQDFAEAANWYLLAAEQGHFGACKEYGVLLSNGQGVARNCDEALVWLRKFPDFVNDQIAQIEKEASDLASETSCSKILMGIRAGDSVFGTTGEGNTLLHTAAMNLVLEPVALLIEHPLFDDLVVRTNAEGQLPRDVVGKRCSASERDSATARVIASALSCRRSTRAACLLWCVQHALTFPSLDRRVALPREVGESIARFVVSPPDSIGMLRVTGASTLGAGLAVSGEHAKGSNRSPSGTKRGADGSHGTQDDIEEPEAKRAKSDP